MVDENEINAIPYATVVYYGTRSPFGPVILKGEYRADENGEFKAKSISALWIQDETYKTKLILLPGKVVEENGREIQLLRRIPPDLLKEINLKRLEGVVPTNPLLDEQPVRGG